MYNSIASIWKLPNQQPTFAEVDTINPTEWWSIDGQSKVRIAVVGENN